MKSLYYLCVGDSIWQECYSKSVYNGHAVRPTGGALRKHRGHTEISFTTSPTVHIICMHTVHQQREREKNLQRLQKMHQIRNIILPKYNHQETGTGTDYRQKTTPR